MKLPHQKSRSGSPIVNLDYLLEEGVINQSVMINTTEYSSPTYTPSPRFLEVPSSDCIGVLNYFAYFSLLHLKAAISGTADRWIVGSYD